MFLTAMNVTKDYIMMLVITPDDSTLWYKSHFMKIGYYNYNYEFKKWIW